MGDSIATNPFLLGYAWQKGMIPLSDEALLRAIELNGVAVEANKQAFLWGRRAAHDLASVERAAAPALVEPATHRLSRTLEDLIAKRVEHLTRYQNRAYAERYRALVERVRQAEETRAKGMMRLAPGGPFDKERKVTAEVAANLARAYHLDEPLFMQFGRYLGGLLQGDFGPSFQYKDFNVSELIWHGFHVSWKLGLSAMVIAFVLGVSVGSLAALRQNSVIDYATMPVRSRTRKGSGERSPKASIGIGAGSACSIPRTRRSIAGSRAAG